MNPTEEIREAAEVMRSDVRTLINDFVKKYGECNIMINTEAKFVDIANGRTIYAGHDVEINVVI